MTKLTINVNELNQSKGLGRTYTAQIQHSLAEALKRTTAECLWSTKQWKADIENQLQLNKSTKILRMTVDEVDYFQVHAMCRYSWKSTLRWQYQDSPESTIWILRKYFKAGCQYLTVLNRQMNMLILIPRSELDNAKVVEMEIINKFNDKKTIEPVYLVDFKNNKNIEIFYKSFDSSSELWTKIN